MKGEIETELAAELKNRINSSLKSWIRCLRAEPASRVRWTSCFHERRHSYSFAEPMLLTIKQDLKVVRLAALYLRWYSFYLPSNCIYRSRCYFQSQGHFYIQIRMIYIVAPLNILANYLLVWGPAFIRLGFIRAPIAYALTLCLISLPSFIHGAHPNGIPSHHADVYEPRCSGKIGLAGIGLGLWIGYIVAFAYCKYSLLKVCLIALHYNIVELQQHQIYICAIKSIVISTKPPTSPIACTSHKQPVKSVLDRLALQHR
ncbi:hypothetical protein E4T56_gene342 [Termitomyces sp. T112]|nr:hypothetical protein E4T56_gene342 [Termitomyces sp. T112]